MTLSASGVVVWGSVRGGRMQGTVDQLASLGTGGERLTARLIFRGSLRGHMNVSLTEKGAGFSGYFWYTQPKFEPRSWTGTCIGGACLKNRHESIAFKAVADGRGICVNGTPTKCDDYAPVLPITAHGVRLAR